MWIVTILFSPDLSSFRLTFPLDVKCCASSDLWGVTARSDCVDWNVKALHSAGCGRFREDLNSLHPYTVPRIQELPSFCWAGVKVQKWREEKWRRRKEHSTCPLNSQLLMHICSSLLNEGDMGALTEKWQIRWSCFKFVKSYITNIFIVKF